MTIIEAYINRFIQRIKKCKYVRMNEFRPAITNYTD